jgi:hypothetical protein
MTDSHKHHGGHQDDLSHGAVPIKNKFMENILKITNIFDAPATFFHGNFLFCYLFYRIFD